MSIEYMKLNAITLEKNTKTNVSKSELLSQKAGWQKDIEIHLSQIEELNLKIQEIDNLLAMLEG